MYNTNKKNYPTQMKFIKQSPEWNEQNTDKIIVPMDNYTIEMKVMKYTQKIINYKKPYSTN